MDIKAYVQTALDEKKAEIIESQQRAEKRIANAKAQLEDIKRRTDIPEKTDTIARIEKANGRAVLLEDSYHTYETTLNFKDGRINTDAISYPLIGLEGEGIKKITDVQTGEVIFDNPYFDANMSFKYAMLIGREAGIEEAQKELGYAMESKERLAKEYDKIKRSVDKIPAWIERGEKFIYPQRQEDWQKCVAARATDLYLGTDLENAIDIMEALDKGDVKGAKKLLEDAEHTGSSYSMTMHVVAKYSKHGPEFYEEVQQCRPDWVQHIIDENEDFKAELEDNNNK